MVHGISGPVSVTVRMLAGFLVALVFLAACQPGGEAGGEGSPIFTLVRNNNADRLNQYLAEGGDPNLVNEDGDTLLYVASGAKGGVEVARVLVLGGADLNKLSRQGRTPLHTAAAWCNADIVALLLEAGARTDIKNSDNELAIESVCTSPAERREEVMALFLQARAAR